MPVALFDLVARPEDWLKERGRNLADAARHARHRVHPAAVASQAESPLETGFERCGPDFFVERERAARRHHDAVQRLGSELDVVRLLGDRAGEGGGALANQLANAQL